MKKIRTAGRSLLLAAAVLSASAGGALAQGVELFVAPNGNDTWSGRLAAPNAAKSDGPFATLERARDEIRKARAAGALKGAGTVYLRGGVYYLDRTLQLDKRDGGSADSPVVYRAYPNEKPLLIGGKAVGGFTPYKGKILQADLTRQGLKGANFRQLIFNGRRQHLARYPNFDPANPYGGGWAYADGKYIPMYQDVPGEDRRTLRYKIEDAREWARPQDGEVFVFPRYNWWNNIVRIKAIDREKRVITLAGDCSYEIRPTDRYYVRGMFEELDSPGEWYLDAQKGILYFWPPDGTSPSALTVYVPTLRTILEIGAGASHISVRGLTFECCEGTAVSLAETDNCLIAGCTIRNVGDYRGSGVSVHGGRNNRVAGCDIHDTGSHGIDISGGDRITLTPANNAADNNYIHHTGVFYKQGVGVSLRGCGNAASHNLIHDCPRFGIQFSGNNLVIEYNHIRHINLETADTGVVYTGGRDWISSRGTKIQYNYFHDSLGFGYEDGRWVSPHYSWGVYLDDNTGGVDVVGNIVVRAYRALLHLHNGRDNRIENNIFVGGRLQQIEFSGWTPTHPFWKSHLPTMIQGYESVANQPAWKAMRNMHIHPTQAVLPDGNIMSGNVLRRNIICYRDPDARLVQARNFPFGHNESDYNLIWHYGLPLRTGQQKIKETTGPNLAPNPDFEETGTDGLPKAWRWQHRPEGARAAADSAVRALGTRSLRIEGASSKDTKERTTWPTLVSSDIPAKPGQFYRLTARLRGATAGTRASLMIQSYVANVYFWSKEETVAAGPDWREHELVFKFPAPGDPDYKPEMKAMCVRLEIRQPSGMVWVDNVA
ncbi:MAG: right-handed parallel beta-helix repeat-containing protein, partial [Candidatus Sumerlaeia bacterium]|nr:right-handed parallel beta-helix repeat-containing protein [Candidatus Sumerlaeia bacterium]